MNFKDFKTKLGKPAVDVPADNQLQIEEEAIALIDEYFDGLVQMLQTRRAVIINDVKSGATPLHRICFGNEIEAAIKTCSPDTSIIFSAAAAGQLDILRQALVDHPTRITCRSSEGQTPLYIALKNGHMEAFEMLANSCKNQESIDFPNNDGATAMYLAVQKADIKSIEMLVRLGSKAIEKENRYVVGPMHAAATGGNVDVIETLFRLGSKAHKRDSYWRITPIYLAAQNGHALAIEALHRLGSSVDEMHNERTSMNVAAENGHVDVIETLVRLGSTQLDASNSLRFPGRFYSSASAKWSPLAIASKNGHLEAVETLVRLGSRAIDMPIVDEWYFRDDSSEGRNADEYHGFTPMHVAAHLGDVKLIDLLVRMGSKSLDRPVVDTHKASGTPSKSFRTPMHLAAERGHSSAIDALVRLGSRAIDTPNSDEQTPLHIAAMKGHVQVVRSLVQLGSRSIDVVDGTGDIPMHYAAATAQGAVAEALVQLGSKALDARNKRGLTPMHKAAGNRKPNCQFMIEVLVRLGCKTIDAPCNKGMTPIHHAANQGQWEHVKELVRLGSKAIDTPDKRGLTPLQAAFDNFGCNRGIVDALIALGADETRIKHHPKFRKGWSDSTFQEKTRFDVYFAQSLTSRLLFQLSLPESIEPRPVLQ